jgi:hypothetical protein
MEINKCEFCKLNVHTRQHHLIPRARGGIDAVACCETCESYLHKTWDHRQLRDTFNSVEAILANEGFQKFLKWRRKQPAETLFKSDPGKYRDKNPYH